MLLLESHALPRTLTQRPLLTQTLENEAQTIEKIYD